MFGPRVERTRAGQYRLRLPDEERELIVSLVGELRAMVGTEDPSLRRLTPPAYEHDADREREYRELVGDELSRSRARSLDVVEATARADRLDEDQMGAWLAAVNDLRLVLGTRLEVTEELYDQGLPEDDPRAPRYAVYAYLGWLEEQIVDSMAKGLGR